MSTMVVKSLNRLGSKTLRPAFRNILRKNSNEPCAPEGPPEPCAKPEQAPAPSCGNTPPCPPMPQCPSAICPQVADPNNPCNYCPPPCIDPEKPDLTRLKKLQCHYQKMDGTPVFLKKGNSDVILFQITLLLTLFSCGYGIYLTTKFRNK